MIDEVDGASNSVSPRREPAPSLGMVAHIWAGHLGPVDVTDAADAATDDWTDPSVSPFR